MSLDLPLPKQVFGHPWLLCGNDKMSKSKGDFLTVSLLEERGYNPINQIVGYLISGDPGYISSYKDARNKIQKIDRSKIIEILLAAFHEQNK